MAESWTTPADVIDSWVGGEAPDNPNLVQVWIDRAERYLRARIPNLEDRITSGDEPDLLDSVKDVVAAMVGRVFRNPDGVRQETTTAGPYSENRTYGGELPGSLFLTDSELGQLLLGARFPGQAFEIDPLEHYAGPPWHPAHGSWWWP
ncbi:Gp19/Gp15/Gp42 family protein [Gryllotalpicola protaetiae]|uniref:Head-to-tail adaptor n=1 Tax=Gryllotalpicola protaetiae TaxID=2419771 RepID=A0A387BJE4_9MICO|nr:Gp19/Gp15/Gp42 family protein [Gryllotalpicola protaetiae]AYG02372.1 hypothetical protein D7I44_01705 [Gryllotalpicola protaetiae]